MLVLRRIAAVVAGFLLVLVGHTATDAALEAAGVFPPPGQPFEDPVLLSIALGYRMAWQVAAGWLTAFIAPDHPMRHAMILAGLGLSGAVAGAVMMWNVGPHWYPIALAVSVIPTLWLGARLREWRLTRRAIPGSR